jgi:3-hydroxyisobutyrate dehydrogenase
VLDAVKDGPLDIGYMQMKGRAMMARDFEPSFRLRLAAKDAGLVADAVDLHGLDLPLVAAIRDRLEQGIPDHGEKDMSATYLTSSPGA